MALRLRVRFSKLGKIRFIGHRDVARVFERAVRKVGLPVAYSEGFSPRMKLSFGLALPTGYESEAEFLELPLEDGAVSEGSGEGVDGHGAGPTIAGRDCCFAPCDGEEPGAAAAYCTLAVALSEALPVGMSVSAAVLSDGSGPSLQAAVLTCGWRFEVAGLDPELAPGAVDSFLAADTVVAERLHKGEAVSSDIRPGVVALGVVGPSGRGTTVCAELSASPRVVRPSELVAALAPSGELGLARRTHQWTCGASGRAEPALPTRCAQLRQETQDTLQ